MRLKVSRSKNAASFYVTKTVYEGKKERTVTVEKLGTEKELRQKLNGADPYEWAKAHIAELNRLEREQKREILVPFKQSSQIERGKQRSFNGGYLFLQKLYYSLGLNKICSEISGRYKFDYDLNDILSRLLYGRILFPSSKLSTFEESKKYLEAPKFELQHIYRALDVICKEDGFIQSELYKNSKAISKRNDKVLFYDCTNFFFETEREEGLKQYGASKEHRPNPIVEMGLFMDGDGIPLAFSIRPGNENEQKTLIPLEEQLVRDFEHAKFIVCTDAGLSSAENRQFNNIDDRAFITAQSIKKLKKYLQDWALDKTGWKRSGDSAVYDLGKFDDPAEAERFSETVFYKERWIKEGGLEQKLVVTFSLKYRNYQRNIRTEQLNRAQEILSKNPSNIKKHGQNDCKRFIKNVEITDDGEVAEKSIYSLDTERIAEEAKYDGFYAVCTNLEDEPSKIVEINRSRWEIEECFRIMKTDFKARPVYLSRDERVKAHFMTCFLALVLFRYLEKKLENRFTCEEILGTLCNMNFLETSAGDYIPTYTRTALTDALHEAFGFRTDYQIIERKNMKGIFKITKKSEALIK